MMDDNDNRGMVDQLFPFASGPEISQPQPMTCSFRVTAISVQGSFVAESPRKPVLVRMIRSGISWLSDKLGTGLGQRDISAFGRLPLDRFGLCSGWAGWSLRLYRHHGLGRLCASCHEDDGSFPEPSGRSHWHDTVREGRAAFVAKCLAFCPPGLSLLDAWGSSPPARAHLFPGRGGCADPFRASDGTYGVS